MEIFIRDTPEQVASIAADIVETHVKRGENIGLATGATPLKTYQELIRRHQEEDLSFAGVTAFLLDEYIGLEAGHEQSYYRFIREHFTSHIDIEDGRVFSPNGVAERPWEAAQEYEASIVEAGGVGVQILGIGTNGHIGFNEPATSLRSRTRVVTLHHQTVSDNARFFEDESQVPTHAITQGLATISDSRHPVLLATGAGKARAVSLTVEGALSAACPASVLQLHPHATVIVDAAAASELKELDYYKAVEARRPTWMGIDGHPLG